MFIATRLLCILFVCVFSTQIFASTAILKSPNDERQYRSLKLENGLRVLLVSDPGTDKAAAAMDVAVGSADDPKEYQGLAHFLEHMLFLGTERFPEAGAYQRFISEHGGHHNAFTSLENTNYFFDVTPEHLTAALERFAQQFISPLFNPEYVRREVNAVHSEFTSKIKDDGRRLYSAVKQVLHPDHPYGKFSVGNLSTLKANEEAALRSAMLDFYQQHYAASNMRLVVLGKQNLNTLEKTVRQLFAPIRNFEVSAPSPVPDFFKPEQLPAKLEVNSIKDQRSLMLAFPIPSTFKHHRSKPVMYLANLLGHEGDGSLLASLKQKGLADSLSAGSHFDNKHQEIFTLSLGLTQQGLDNYDAVLKEIFSYIRLIEQEGFEKRHFTEQARMLDVSFRFQEKSEPIHFVSALANALHDFSAESVLYAAYRLDEYRPDLYRQYLRYLNPDNTLVVLQAQHFDSETTSPWYETPYRIAALEPSLLKALRNVPLLSSHAMPEENPFLPDTLELVHERNQAIPELLINKTGIALWHQTDTQFNTPKANLFLSIRSPHAMASARNQNLSEILASMFRDTLNTFSYPAYLAGLNYQLYNHLRGLTIKVSGYSDKQSALLNRLLNTIKYGQLTETRFEIIKERLARKLANAQQAKPYEQAFTALHTQLLNPSWDEITRLNALESTTFEDLQNFRKAFFTNLNLAILSAGNVSRASSLNIAAQIESTLMNGATPTEVDRARVERLHDHPATYQHLTVNHNDNAMVMYLQGSQRDHQNQARMQLLTQMVAADYYNELRTEKQLGYIVLATYMPLMEVPGLVFAIQSPSASGEQLVSETYAFLSTLEQKLSDMPTDFFNRHRQAVISKINRQDKTLFQQSNYFWQEIDRKNEAFNTRAQLIDYLEKMSQQDMLSFLKEIFADALKNKFAILATPQDTIEIPNWKNQAARDTAPNYFSEY